MANPEKRIRFAKRLIEKAPIPEKGDVWLHDAEVPGLVCRIRPSGARTFLVDYRVDGRRRRYTLGAFGPLTVENARDMALDVLRDAKHGADALSQREARRQAVTLKEFSEEYLQRHSRRHKRPKSVVGDETLFKLHIVPRLGSKQLPTITRADVSTLRDDIGAEHPTTANRALALLSHCFALSEKWGRVPPGHVSPTRGVEKYRERPRERYLDEGEFRRLGDALTRLEAGPVEIERDGKKETVRAIMPSQAAALRVLLLTGCRLREVSNLTWREVDFDNGRFILADGRSKSHGKKIVPLAPSVVAYLHGLPREGVYVFPGYHVGKPINADALRPSLARVCEVADIRDLRVHDLRHSFGAAAAGAGVPLQVLGSLLGHTQASTTQRYAHVGQTPAAAAAGLIGDSLAAVVLPKQREAEIIEMEQAAGGESK